jgi:hypothetical protein
MVLKQGLVLASAGGLIGVALWLLASRPIMSMIEAHSFGWSLLALVALGLLCAAGLGAYLPARACFPPRSKRRAAAGIRGSVAPWVATVVGVPLRNFGGLRNTWYIGLS